MTQEIEFKFAVDDEHALDAFAESLGHDRRAIGPRIQRNNFFDTRDGRLRKARLALRLRLENDRAILTIKGADMPLSNDSALTERFEAESSVSPADAKAVLDGSLSPLGCSSLSDDATMQRGIAMVEAALNGMELVLLGSFDNERTTLPPHELDVGGRKEHIVFELDRTSFPHGRVDCEIEAEIDAKANAELLELSIRRLLERAEIRWRPAKSKLARFTEIVESGA